MALASSARRRQHASHAVAVYIGRDQVRAVEVDTRGGQSAVTRCGQAPAPADAWDRLGEARPQLVQAVRGALAAGGITATHVVTALPRRMVTLKYARLPHAPAEHVRGMVELEAQQYVPFPMADAVIDHQVIVDDADDLTTVLIAAARRTMVAELMAVFDAAGLHVDSLSVSALGLAEHAAGSVAPVALVAIEPGEMEMAVVGGGRVLFTRAAALESDAGGGGRDRQLASEVSRSLIAYRNEFRAGQVTRVEVAGPEAESAAAREVLANALQADVEPLRSALFPTRPEDAGAYAVAAGLALEAAGGGLSRINLTPSERTERRQAVRRRFATGVALAVTAVVLVVGAFATQAALTRQKAERSAMLRENQKLRTVERALKEVRAEHSELVEDYNAVLSGLGRRLPVVDAVKALSDATPAKGGVYLTQLSFDRAGAMTVQGKAKAENAATRMVSALQATGAFDEVRLGYIGDAAGDRSRPRGAAALVPGPLPLTDLSFQIVCRLHRDTPAGSGPGPRATRETAPSDEEGVTVASDRRLDIRQ